MTGIFLVAIGLHYCDITHDELNPHPMLNLHYSMVDNCTVLAYDPQSKTEKWRRSLRTYFRNKQKIPIITLQVIETSVMASWPGSSVVIDTQTGDVQRYIRSMFLVGPPTVTFF